VLVDFCLQHRGGEQVHLPAHMHDCDVSSDLVNSDADRLKFRNGERGQFAVHLMAPSRL
jgi:hypothetical protein